MASWVLTARLGYVEIGSLIPTTIGLSIVLASLVLSVELFILQGGCGVSDDVVGAVYPSANASKGELWQY